MKRISLLRVLSLAIALALLAPRADAQGNCTRSGNGTCEVGNSASYGITLTITKASRLNASTATLILPAATAAQYDAGFGTPAPLGIILHANTPWTVGIRSNATNWSTSPGGRPNKPATDLQYSLDAVGGPYTDLTTSYATTAPAGATAGTVATLFFRTKYSWTLDRPATYTLPISFVLTAP